MVARRSPKSKAQGSSPWYIEASAMHFGSLNFFLPVFRLWTIRDGLSSIVTHKFVKELVIDYLNIFSWTSITFCARKSFGKCKYTKG